MARIYADYDEAVAAGKATGRRRFFTVALGEGYAYVEAGAVGGPPLDPLSLYTRGTDDRWHRHDIAAGAFDFLAGDPR